MNKYIIAHDLGTSGNKATLFTSEGQMLKSCIEEYPVRYFNDTWAEQDAEDWWNAVCSATKHLLNGIDPREVVAVSFSGQMMGCICVDENGDPLRKAIIWADMRAEKQEKELASKIAPETLYRITGHTLSRSYSLEKLMWVRDNEPEIYEKTFKMLHAKDFIVQRLTGEFVTDMSDASGTNAYDLRGCCWSEEIIRAAGVRRELFPDIRPSTFVAGTIDERGHEATGLAVGTKVVLGGGDGSCASVGAGSISEGLTYNCLGSSSWISTVAKEPYCDPQMRTVTWAHVIPGLTIPSGTMQTAGSAFEWGISHFCSKEIAEAKEKGVSPYAMINEAIAASKPGANGIIFLPYLLGERCPRWNSNARAVMTGLKMEHTTGDLMRSIVEGVAMNLNVILGILKNAVPINEMYLVGGLAKGEIQQQIFADVYGMDVIRMEHLGEATSIGAAVIAGVGAGVLQDFNSVELFNRKGERRPVNPDTHSFYVKQAEIFEDCYRSQLDIYEKLAAVQ